MSRAINNNIVFDLFLQATYRCDAEANPVPYHNSYKWYIDDHQVQGQFREYFKIYNVTSVHNNKQIKCSVENELGTAMGLRTIEVKCEYNSQSYHRLPQLKVELMDHLKVSQLYCFV